MFEKLKNEINLFCDECGYINNITDDEINNGFIILEHTQYSQYKTSYIAIDLTARMITPYSMLLSDEFNKYADLLGDEEMRYILRMFNLYNNGE